MTTSAGISELDVSRVRGTYVVHTESGSRYIIEADRRATGYVQWTTDHAEVSKSSQEGCVGLVPNQGLSVDYPTTIQVGAPLVISRGTQREPLRTTKVTRIVEADEGVTIDSFICNNCRGGFKEGSGPCVLCRH